MYFELVMHITINSDKVEASEVRVAPSSGQLAISFRRARHADMLLSDPVRKAMANYVTSQCLVASEDESVVIEVYNRSDEVKNNLWVDDVTYIQKHKWFLSADGLNILPSLLLPLSGPEEFSEDENDKLPIELQYLPETKTREPDPDIRRMLLETLLQFCSSKEDRITLRDQNVYLILRELHKTEVDRQVLLACENVVDILIRTEEEIGIDKLNEVTVPNDLQETFQDMDQKFIGDSIR